MPSSGNTLQHDHRSRCLKILHIDPEKAWGGGEVQVTGLTTYLHRAGHHSVVAAAPHGLLYVRLQQEELPVLPLRIRNDLDVVAGLQLRRLVQAHDYDIVHFHTARAHALSPWLHGVRVKRLVTRRMDYPLRPGFRTRLLYQYSVDRIVAISQGVRSALLAGGAPAARIHLIPSGVDTSRFAPDPTARHRVRTQHHIAPQTPLIVSVGALVDRKDHATLLIAAHLLKAQGHTVRYLISGEGRLRPTLEAQAQTLGLTEEVSFIGFCADIPGLLSAADLFVHTPLHEGLGVAVMEALAAELPTIASRVGGIPEMIEDETTGLLVPPHDAEALSTALSRLLSRPQFARQLGKTGEIFAKARFDVNVMARANEALYLDMITDTP